MDPKDRDVLKLLLLEVRTEQAVAADMGVSQQMVSKRRKKGLAALRRAIA